MMQDETAEIQVQQRTKQQFISSFYDEAGPDDEFRPVKISIVSTSMTQQGPEPQESRDEGSLNVFGHDEDRETIRATEAEPRATEETEAEPRESVAIEEDDAEPEGIEVAHDHVKKEDTVHDPASPRGQPKELEESSSYVSELTKSKTGDDDEKISATAPSESKSVSLFDTSLLDEEDNEDRQVVDADDLSVVSKSVVDESRKNVAEAEALAQEMKRQLAESLAQHSSTTPSPSIEGDEKEGEAGAPESEQELPTSSSSVSTRSGGRSSKRNKSQAVSIEIDAMVGSSNHRLELPIANANPESASASSVSSSSSKSSAALRRSRPTFRHRRPSTSSWVGSTDDTTSADGFLRRLPITQDQERILTTIVIPAVFLVAAVAICRTFFHSWLKVGNDHSTAWALTWTVLCIIAVVAPVCALEYVLLGGFVAGTVVQETLAKYPEFKRFLRDVRRMRLKAGWWYPSEVRTLRKDLETSNAELLSQQERTSLEAQDDRSIRRQMSREEHRKEKVQLEKIFDAERSEWTFQREAFMSERAANLEENSRLRNVVESEQQKQMQIAAQKEQLENNITVERSQWKFSRLSLEDALRAAVAAQKDNAIASDFYHKLEAAQEEERALWEKEREGFQSSIKQAEEDALQLVKDHEGKIRLFDDMRAAKQSEWESDRKSLQEAVKNAVDEAKEVKNALDSQICKLMDADDEKYEKYEVEVEKISEKFFHEKEDLEQMLEDARGEQEVTSRCVQNLQSVLEDERSQWTIERETLRETARSAKLKETELAQKLERTGRVFDEERAAWDAARANYEDAAESAVANSAADDDRRSEKSFRDDLKSKESKIKALEESIAQYENILSIQERVELSSKSTTQKQSNTAGDNKRRRQRAADREADGLVPVAYVVPHDEDEMEPQSSFSSTRGGGRSIELSSSRDSTVEDSSSYYSWARRIQETHGREVKDLLRGMLKQHVRWQEANHHVGQLLASSKAMLEASSFTSDDSVGAEHFHGSIAQYTSASVSAKVYMDRLVTRTGHEDLIELLPVPSLADSSIDGGKSYDQNQHHNAMTDNDEVENEMADNDEVATKDSNSHRSVAVVTNPWSKNAPLWQQVWSSFFTARLSPIRLCTVAARTVCSGIYGNTLGLLHRRGAKPKQPETDATSSAESEATTR